LKIDFERVFQRIRGRSGGVDTLVALLQKQHGHRGGTPDAGGGGHEEELNDVRSASEVMSRASLNQAKPNSTTSTASVVVNLPSSYPASELMDTQSQHEQQQPPSDAKQQSVVRISTL
jgi:hypothetical protein